MIFKYDKDKAFDYENGFILTSDTYRLGNMMAHYELYKLITNLPGDIIELGVFKGNSLIQFATFRELLENEKSRKIIGFDIFGEFPKSNQFESDKKFVEQWNKDFVGDIPSEKEINLSLSYKKIGNVDLVKGDILDTLPEFVISNPQLKIAMLHIDTDVYEPSKLALELLYEKVVPGGVIIFDDYAVIEGETKAVDEFFEDKGYIFEKFSFSHTKPTFIIKKL